MIEFQFYKQLVYKADLSFTLMIMVFHNILLDLVKIVNKTNEQNCENLEPPLQMYCKSLKRAECYLIQIITFNK